MRTWWTVRLLAAVLVVASMGFQTVTAQVVPNLQLMGFSANIAPADKLECRQSIAYALDRETIARTVAPVAPLPTSAAIVIQHPRLPGYNPAVRGYRYDSTKAKELFAQCGWTGPITISVSSASDRFVTTLRASVTESLSRTLGPAVSVQIFGSVGDLARAWKEGKIPIYMFGWGADARDFGYPSFALGIAHEVVNDPEVRALVDKRDAGAVEQMLLDKALIIPVIYY